MFIMSLLFLLNEFCSCISTSKQPTKLSVGKLYNKANRFNGLFIGIKTSISQSKKIRVS